MSTKGPAGASELTQILILAPDHSIQLEFGSIQFTSLIHTSFSVRADLTRTVQI